MRDIESLDSPMRAVACSRNFLISRRDIPDVSSAGGATAAGITGISGDVSGSTRNPGVSVGTGIKLSAGTGT
jgi:hypothetical protein